MGGPESMFRQTVTYAAETSVDAYGKPTLGSSSTAAARIQPEQRLMKDALGIEFQSTHVIYTAAAIELSHRVYLPGETLARRVQVILKHVDGLGTERYRKLVLG